MALSLSTHIPHSAVPDCDQIVQRLIDKGVPAFHGHDTNLLHATLFNARHSSVSEYKTATRAMIVKRSSFSSFLKLH